jgi:hypothetical protein
MRDETGPFKKSTHVIGYSLLVPMALAPLAWMVLLLLSRLAPDLAGFLFEASGRLFEALIPEGGCKGLLVPIFSVASPPMLIGDLGAALLAWRVWRSMRLATISLTISLSSQLISTAVICGIVALAC